MYVTDDLQLALHEQHGSKGKLLKRLQSGTKLVVLEEKGMYAKVKTPEGTVGWTKAGFLMDSKPARALLLELREENLALKKTIEDTNHQNQTQDSECERCRAEKIQVALELAEYKEKDDLNVSMISDLKAELQDLQAQVPSNGRHIPLNWLLVIAPFALLAGFIGGMAFIDWRIRRRHGGYRVY